MITLIAHAKLNLFLDITGKLSDGYHLLETVMQSVDLSDIVTIELADGYHLLETVMQSVDLSDIVTIELADEITVSSSDPEIPEDEDNICYKAAELFYALLGQRGGADIYIDKRIPHGAGLGGGSADAAATLRGLNRLHGKPFDDNALLKLAAKTGADVPFCLIGGTKLCKGIGDVMTDEKPYKERDFLIVKPSFECDTKAAYESYDVTMIPRRERQEGEYYNVFREIYKNKEINEIAEKLKSLGATAAELTGSGSAVFGAFEDEYDAADAAKKFPMYFTAVCRAASKGISVLDVRS